MMQRWAQMVSSQPRKATKSGNPLSVYIAGTTVDHLAVTFLATQSGSGTPAPDNVRTINGLTTVSAVIDDQTISAALGSTYYGGLLDIVTGTLMVTHVYKTFAPSDFITFYPSGSTYSNRVCTSKATMSGISTGSSNPQGAVLANCMTCKANGAANNTLAVDGPFLAMSGTAGNTSLFLMFPDSYNITTLALAQAWLTDHPLTGVFRLATPTSVSLTPQAITGSTGMHTITTDAESVSITCYTI